MAFTKIAAAGIGTTETVTVDGLTVINNGSFGGNLTVSGVLTYEDVTNVDSVGLITARNGIVVGSGITLSKDGNIFATGISTLGGDIQMSGDNPEFEMNAGGPRFRVPASNTLTIHTGGGLGSTNEERLRITSGGTVGINETSPDTNFKLDVGGSANIQGNVAVTNTGRVYFGNSDVASIDGAHGGSGYLKFLVAGAEKMQLNSSGNLLLGTTTAAVSGGVALMIAGSAGGRIKLCDSDLGVTATDGFELIASDNGTAYVWNRENTDLLFGTNNTEALRIDSSGRLLINTTNNSNGHISSSNLAVQGADLAIFKDSGGDNAGVSGHKLKFVTQSGSLGEIDVLSEGGGGPSGRGGAMLFYTKENNTSSAAERARITSTGLFGIGVTPSYQFHVKAGSVDQTARFDNAKTADTDINYIGVSLSNAGTTGTGLFGMTGHSTVGSQACWIGMAGDDVAGGYGLKVFRGGNAVNMQRFAIGTQDHSGFVSGTDASMIISYQKTYRFALYIRPSDNNTGGGSPALFANQAGTAIGSISANASNVAFNTSSDYRLKENDVSIIDGITRLKKLRPIKFNWKTDTEKTVDGFLAHEVSSSVPEAVMGEKDAVNEDGSIKPQQLDYSKLVPLLTAALQEEIAKRESLEARLDAAGL